MILMLLFYNKQRTMNDVLDSGFYERFFNRII